MLTLKGKTGALVGELLLLEEMEMASSKEPGEVSNGWIVEFDLWGCEIEDCGIASA